MTSTQLSLFKDKRFLPIFIVQFCGCLNDSILKNALIILVTFKLAGEVEFSPQVLVLFANVIFIAPFFIFASLAGQIADRYERSFIVKIIKIIEVAIVLATSYGFYYTNLKILYSCIALMGIHSSFFGPIKYSVLPDQLHKSELLAANGFIEAGTFFSILVGTMIGGFYTVSAVTIIILAIIVSAIGLGASFFMPKSNNSNPEIKINPNIFAETREILKYAHSKKQVYLSILGISWFWFIGTAILSQIPMLTKDILGADEHVANLFLATFSIGVGVGSFLCSKLFDNQITTKYVFIAALGISICGIDLYFASKIASVSFHQENLKTVMQFLQRGHYWRILFDLFALAAIGGLYVVPLFAAMQYFSLPAYRSRVIAANNLINALFMAGSTVILSLLFYLNFTIPSAILLISILNIVVAVHIYKLIPNTRIVPLKLWRGIFKLFFTILYKVEVKGFENYKKAGKKTVIVANHLSYIDPPLIATYIPDNMIFAINLTVAKEWWVRPFLKIMKTFPIESNNPMAIKSLIAKLKQNRKIAIFPEGRVSVTGSLMKVYEGPGMIADKVGASILPIRVDGTQFTRFSKVRKTLKGGFAFRKKITITILPPVKFSPPENLDQRGRRKYLGSALYDLMSEMLFESSEYKITLFQSLINSAKLYGMNNKIVEDIEGNSSSYRSMLLKSFIVAELISNHSKKQENVGLMMPNMAGSIISFFGIMAAGRVPAMINYTSGADSIISSCHTSCVKVIFTSKKFIEKAELEDEIKIISESGISIIYFEDLKKELTSVVKIKCLIASYFPQTYYDSICAIRNDLKLAVILFTSGTEGKPKAVALSHRNLQANRYQAASRFDFNSRDLSFNALPIFHSFGLTGSLIMVLSGVRTFFYPSPLNYRIIPEIIYNIGATIMLSTDTFFNGYAQNAHPYDFYSLRVVIAGGERLKPTTRQLWMNKYGVRIFEGYGVTEASPVIAANTPMYDKPGSVGRLMPKIEYFIQPVDGINEGGRLCVKGPNIMMGYMLPETPGIITSPEVEKLGEGWYNTGDIVSIDSEGYLTIIAREKRFAKIAGEMVSLSAVEELSTVDDAKLVAAICIPDEKKGEQIILFTQDKSLTREKIIKLAREKNVSELLIPKKIIVIPEIPVLATGKINYRKILEILMSTNH
jgi:acyl-[acyl-carrier-protein]-phospholipid O-acyltransferase/long-chain-fatty-acid--[acyl-carrier-protein] ligase